MSDERNRPTNRDDLRDRILQRAAVDREFRQGLLDAPRRTIRATFGVEIPEDYRLRFVEKDPDVDSLVVLPDFRGDDEELDDDDLDRVAGGFETDFYWSPSDLP